MKHRFARLLAAALLLALLGGSALAQEVLSFTDDLGRAVTLPARPQLMDSYCHQSCRPAWDR